MPVNNASNFLLYNMTGFPEFKNPVPKVVYSSSSSTGNVDLYTVPTGKKVFIAQLVCTPAAQRNIRLSINIGGTYNVFGETTLYTTAAFLVPNFCIVLSGEKIAYNLAGTSTTVNARLSFWEFDDDTPITRGALFTLAAGNNTVYTCPTGKQAYPLSFHRDMFAGRDNTSLVNYINDSGGSRTISIFCVPNGGSPSNANRTYTETVATGTNPFLVNNNLAFPTLNAGDSFVLNTDASTATQTAWVNVVERNI